MDPFSIAVGAVALLETANKLSKTLLDRYQAFSAAPKKMCEVANDITMVAGLVDVFSTSVEGAGSGIKFPDKFQRDTRNLVDQVCIKNNIMYSNVFEKLFENMLSWNEK